MNESRRRGRLSRAFKAVTTPDNLALAVIEALDEWEARGRPGARKTFASTAEYFQGKNPAGQFQILDFGTTLLGREEQIRALDDFAKDDRQRVCILSGRGGIGKSKILHDWANSNPAKAVFLKDEPFWHEDSEKEVPITCKTVIIDDAHRQETFGKVLQLLQDTAAHRNLKLLVSTRPGSATRLLQQVLRKIDPKPSVATPRTAGAQQAAKPSPCRTGVRERLSQFRCSPCRNREQQPSGDRRRRPPHSYAQN